jgi:tetratricopeptide (TPR) repeat protein
MIFSRVTTLSGLLCIGLAARVAAPPSADAQSQSVSRKRVHDPAAEELNRLLVDAQAAVEKKDYDTAAKDYLDYLAKKPDDAQVHFNLGFVYTAETKLDEARPEYEKAISLDPKMGPAYLNLGMTLLASDPASAAASLQKATELLPDDARAKFFLGVALERSGKLPEAIAAYETAEAADAQAVDVRLALGHAAATAKRWPDSEKAFRDALGLQPDPNDSAEAYLGLSAALIAQQKFDEASKALDAYSQLRPDDAKIRIERANLLAQLGKDDDALRELDQLPPAQRDSLPTLELRAQIDLHANRTDDAIATLLKAEPLEPKNPDLPASLGGLYMKKKDYANAGHQLAAAFNLNPADNAVLRNLIAAEYQNKNYPTALAAIDVLAKRMDLPADAWFLRAACYDKLGQLQPALDAYKTFLQLNKDENSDMYFDSSVRVRAITRELQNKKK